MDIKLPSGDRLSIAHLQPCIIECECKGLDRKLRIRVAFANHCYTEDFNPDRHDQKDILLYDSPSKPRCFCALRYELSKRLPEIIATLPDQKVHQTPEARNYVFFAKINVSHRPYEIFFMLQRAGKDAPEDLRLTVESAYCRDDGETSIAKRPRAIRFKILALKVLRNERVRFAPR